MNLILHFAERPLAYACPPDHLLCTLPPLDFDRRPVPALDIDLAYASHLHPYGPFANIYFVDIPPPMHYVACKFESQLTHEGRAFFIHSYGTCSLEMRRLRETYLRHGLAIYVRDTRNVASALHIHFQLMPWLPPTRDGLPRRIYEVCRRREAR